MTIRRLVVEVDTNKLNVAEFCRSHGVSRWFFYDLRRRYAAEGDAALELRSTAPNTVANKTALEVEEAIVAKRKELLDTGLDAGPESIAFYLADLPGLPSVSTIYRILRDRGLISPSPAKAPKRSRHRFVAKRANECWQLDDTRWVLADGTLVKILNVIDDHSRLLVASAATRSCTGAFALNVLATAAVVLGWPAWFLSDNAPAFADILAKALGAMGIGSVQSRVRHPQTNGKVERFHQTLKRWLGVRPLAGSIEELQAQLDAFRHLYNHERPHRGIDRAFPAVVWSAAPKSGPSDRPLGVPTQIYAGVVSKEGTISAGRRYMVSLGAAYTGRQATTVVTGLAAHVFVDGVLARQLTIDPTKRVQAMYSRPGHPKRS